MRRRVYRRMAWVCYFGAACVAAALAVSVWWTPFWYVTSGPGFGSVGGAFCIDWFVPIHRNGAVVTRSSAALGFQRERMGWGNLGVVWWVTVDRFNRMETRIIVPLWMPLAAAVLAGAIFRWRAGLSDPCRCASCGYDRRGLAP